MFKSQPFVSVLMPVYNGEKFLKEAVESIIKQTYVNWELVVINDGSFDQSVNIIKSYKDDRIKIYDNAQNMGIVYSLNRGLGLCKGKYIVRMDADDIAYPDRIAQQVQYMEENIEIGISGTLRKNFGENIRSLTNTRLPAVSVDELKCELIFQVSLTHPTTIFRKKSIDRYGLAYGNYIAEDYMLWIEASKHFDISVLPKVLLNYRLSSGQLTEKMKDKNDELEAEFAKGTSSMVKRCGYDIKPKEAKRIYKFALSELPFSEISLIKETLIGTKKENDISRYFDPKTLNYIFGKRWIAYMLNNKSRIPNMIFSMHTIYGIKYTFKKIKQVAICLNKRRL